ncbi:hypothetical protein BU15DRAFT_34935, partial [Melanogaster broomeanus]
IWLDGIYQTLLQMPDGTLGTSYDVLANATEDNLPRGWYPYRASTYAQLARHLRASGYQRLQYSDRCRNNTTAVRAYRAMTGTNMLGIPPPSKLASTLNLKGLKMHYTSD